MRHVHRFAGNPLDRGEQERRDEAWIEAVARDGASRFLPFRKLDVLVADHPHPRLGWLRTDQLRTLAPDARPLLLGLLEGVAHFAVDLTDSAAAVPWAEGQDPPWRFEDCRAAGTVLASAESGILAQARAHLDWHNLARLLLGLRQPHGQQARRPSARMPRPATPSTSRAPIRW